jgi:hypothetical protein
MRVCGGFVRRTYPGLADEEAEEVQKFVTELII